MTKPKPPEREALPAKWPHADLHDRVLAAIEAMPAYFKPETYIEGISAPDLHTLNTMLGATIEEQSVATLNAMRPIWDPDKKYALYSFVRQSQTFPDILLRRGVSGGAAVGVRSDEIIMGIELKGWYVLAKEGMPNFRFTVTPTVCAVLGLSLSSRPVTRLDLPEPRRPLTSTNAPRPMASSGYVSVMVRAASRAEVGQELEHGALRDAGEATGRAD